MIHALDHLVVAVASVEAAVADYKVLLGRRAERHARGGAERASIQLGNVRLELATASGDAGDGLSTLGFAVADLAKTQRLLEQRALSSTPVDSPRGIQLAPEATHGVAIRLIERAQGPGSSEAGDPDSVAGLDHVVIRSPNPERAVALYAGRLGLSLRLDRSAPAWGTQLLFFRCGDLIVEVAHDLKAGIGNGPDRLWGLSWRVPDVARAHARLSSAGVAVSELRTGRRPHTKVFTAKSHTAGVPTLVIGPDA